MLHSQTEQFAKVILDVPLPALDYRVGEEQQVAVGDRVVVPLGRRHAVGVVTSLSAQSAIEAKKLKRITKVLADTRPLSAEWLQLTAFAAEYYVRQWGEAALPALPVFFRRAPGVRHQTMLEKLRELKAKSIAPVASPVLNAEQQEAVDAIVGKKGFGVQLLYGVTGSGKTEVYLHAIAEVLQASPQAQVLLLVPEINLTPQLENRVRARFPEEVVVTMHSGLSQRERAASWLAVHEGRARILVGTRLSVFASFAHLSLVIVDEEHDQSYKAGDGLRYSARDLAVKRAQLNQVPCVLGSATPSLETWNKAQTGAYQLLRLSHRAVPGAHLPRLELIDTRQKKFEVFTDEVRAAVDATLARGEQVLVFVNRRGYAPVITCTACGWVSRCQHCSGFTVYHKAENVLVCHHCGTRYPIPERCPKCGNPDLVPVGTGTQRIEEALEKFWPTARVLRIDRDSVRAKSAADKAFAKIHAGEADIVVGTQMIAKGHDFKRVSLVVILNADAQLVSPDIRAEERLFSTLMQVAGRAGRGEIPGTVMIQTRFPEHPLYADLEHQDYEGCAARLLADRREAHLPPFSFEALLTAQASSLERAQGFLSRVAAASSSFAASDLRLFDPVPMPLMKLMDVERAQMMVEADTRRDLHAYLQQVAARNYAEPGVQWSIEVDPMNL